MLRFAQHKLEASSVDLGVASGYRGVYQRAVAVGEVWILEHEEGLPRRRSANAQRGDVAAAVVELQRLAVRRGDTHRAVLAIDRGHGRRLRSDDQGRPEDEFA